jgi:Osteopetrosis-associated transmembrane protein 1 precursor
MAPLETAIRIHRAPLQNGIKMLSIVGLLLVYLGGAAALVRDLSVDWHRLSPYITCMESGEINTTCVNQLAELSELAADPTEFQNEDSFLLRSAPFSKRETRLSSCQDALAAYGSASSDFMRCAVDFSRPILLCEKCVEYYLHAQETFVAYAEVSDCLID